MSNQSVIGFLIRKTVQPHSQRTDHTNYNDYRNSNIVVYLNKKVGDIRNRIGQTQLPRSVYTSTNLQMKPKARSDEKKKDPFTNYQVDKNVQIVIGNIQKPAYQEDFFIETSGSGKKSKQTTTKPMDVDSKLRALINGHIDEKDLESMFLFYKRQNLKATLNQIKTQMKDPEFLQKFQERVSKKGLATVEFDDVEQVNFFMNKVCAENKDKSTAGRVLGVNEDHIVYKEDHHNDFEAMKNIVQKRIKQEQLIKNNDEEDQQRNLVRIFRETRPDQFDPDFFKNKVKMTTMKRLNEAQDEQYQNFFSPTHVEDKTLSNQRFSRYPKTYVAKFRKTKSKINSLNTQNPDSAFKFEITKSSGSQPALQLNLQSIHEDATPRTNICSTPTAFQTINGRRPQTTTSATRSYLGTFNTERLSLQQKKVDAEVIDNIMGVRALQCKVGDLVEECNQAELKHSKDRQGLMSKIDHLEEDVLKTFTVVDMMDKLQNKDGSKATHKDFDKFLSERKFKKKFVDYLIDHVEKKSDLLSQKTIETSSKYQIAQFLPI